MVVMTTLSKSSFLLTSNRETTFFRIHAATSEITRTADAIFRIKVAPRIRSLRSAAKSKIVRLVAQNDLLFFPRYFAPRSSARSFARNNCFPRRRRKLERRALFYSPSRIGIRSRGRDPSSLRFLRDS